MADDAEDDTLELDDLVIEGVEGDQTDDDATEDADELVISFGDDEAAPASGERDTDLVRHLRSQLREKEKIIAEARRTAPPQSIVVGDKPTLEACEYDEDRFETALDEWKGRKSKAEQVEAQAGEQQRRADEAWAADQQRYKDAKAALKLPDTDDAEATVTAALSPVQQAVLVKCADDAAKLVVALGRNPQRLADLSKIDDPLKLAVAIAKLEGTLKVTTRRKAPEPESIVRGSASVSGSSDKNLERLEAAAAKSGDRSAIAAYRYKQRQKA